MKRWALVVAGLYLLICAVLTVPVILLAFCPKTNWAEVATVYSYWQYWLWLGAMVIGQIAFLAVPVRVASRRPVTQGALWPTLLAGGLMMGGLAFGAICSLTEFAVREHRKVWMDWIALALAVMVWCIWAIVFRRLSRSVGTGDLISRQCRWLLKGSILELLIAVPTHIVARSRDYCCAGFMTFIGLTMGVSVMLFSFGPAVFFLFAERWRRLHPDRGAASNLARANEDEARGSSSANRTART